MAQQVSCHSKMFKNLITITKNKVVGTLKKLNFIVFSQDILLFHFFIIRYQFSYSSYHEDSEYKPDEDSNGSNSEHFSESEYQTNLENNSITDANSEMGVTNSANTSGTISCDPIKQTVEKSRGK